MTINTNTLINNDKFLNNFSLAKIMCDTNNLLADTAIKNLKENVLYNQIIKYFDNDLIELYFRKLLFNDYFYLSQKIVDHQWKIENLKDYKSKLYINQLEINGYALIDKFLKNNQSYIVGKSFLSKIFFKKIIKNIFFKLKKLHKKTHKSFENTISDKTVSIGVQCYEGLDPNYKNDLFWNNDHLIDETNIILYVIKKTDYKRLNLEDYKNIIQVWKLPLYQLDDHFKMINDLILSYNNKNKIDSWLKKELVNFIIQINFWTIFFSSKNIKIDLDTNETDEKNIIKRLALNNINGISIGRNRSYISDKLYHWVGNFPQEILFTWGNDMHGRLLNSYNFNNKILFSGYPYPKTNKKIDFNFNNYIKKKILLIDCMHSKNPNQYICMSSPTIEKFYNRFFDWLDNKKEIGVIFKTKKMSNIYNLNSKIKERIYNLEKEGRVYIEKNPLRNTISNFTSYSNLAICTTLFTPSVMYECLIENLLCLTYSNNPFQENESPFVKENLRDILFNDLNKLFLKLDQLYQDNFEDKSFNWSCIKEIDPYRDSKGAVRIGNFIHDLFKYLNEGINKNQSIKMSINNYSCR